MDGALCRPWKESRCTMSRAAPKRESRLWTRDYELDPARGLRLSLVEDPTANVAGDDAWCSWCIWPAAKVLVEYLASLDDSDLAGKSVLELGSGCGVVGMYLRQRGASPVVLTDVYRALPLLKRNVTANGLQCEVCALPWGTPLERLAPAIRSRAPFDLVVASDCSYDFISPDKPSPSLDALLATLRHGSRALVCVSRRPNEVEAFQAALARAGLEPAVVHRADVNEALEGVPECLVFSFDFRESAGS
mmetsp:Transcript_116681/g.363336  ORF Transcript_116681/g.363336 Transcript_116681/m.363336 type:complete len:248 (-) Transcript_116681:50-793(-)